MSTKQLILVVDDTEGTRYAVARTLKANGFDVIEAANGRDALKLAREHRPALITLDIHLPDIIGFEVCRTLKAEEQTAHIPVLQVSASYVTSKDRIHGLEGGADSYLTHPFEPPVLVATVKALLRTSLLNEQLRQSEERLSLALKTAEEASIAKSRFLSNMSHEMRTPLGVIQGFSELVMDPATSVEERDLFLRKIKSNAENLTKLVSQILDLAKVEAGKIELENDSLNPRELIEEAVSNFEIQAKEKGLALNLKMATLPDKIVGDALRIRQVVLNLISNSIKFTESGSITVDVGVEDHFVRVGVTDTGIGISDEEQARLFQDFSQADTSTTRKYGGTGLGLSLSRRLARALGGDLVLKKSAPGSGSVFEFTFELKIPEAAPSNAGVIEEAAPQEAQTLRGLRVLVAEDSPDNQHLFKIFLQGAGALVRLTSNGREVVRAANNEDFDLILMDVQMPELDGYQATRQLRERGIHLPIVALTANAEQREIRRAGELGFDGYITKPISRDELLKSVERFARKTTNGRRS